LSNTIAILGVFEVATLSPTNVRSCKLFPGPAGALTYCTCPVICHNSHGFSKFQSVNNRIKDVYGRSSQTAHTLFVELTF
jgi:hypothetical protein